MSDVNPLPSNAADGDYRFTNRLIHATSPYLLQHAHNPVDWYPWGTEALARAQELDRPIILSIGYAACHWCHVMERESFENERIAAIMNANYVCIKVDREERPDLDAIYMDAVQALTQRGGWPMTVFLTPEGLPFYAGTYFPPEDRYGMPGFGSVLLQLAKYYRTRRSEVNEQAEEFRTFYAKRADLDPIAFTVEASEVDIGILSAAQNALERSFDMTHGGFGGAPKFPHPMDLEFLLRMHLHEVTFEKKLDALHPAFRPDVTPLSMLTKSLDHMADGGIYDQLGGGFHRYAVDDHWLVPHFEKMLYDNALLARVYLHAYQVTGKERYSRICREILDYVRRDMTSTEGGFYATQDADSEGEEGKFYVWEPAQIAEVLDAEDAHLFMSVYGITESGNFEETGKTVLSRVRKVAEVAAEFGIPVPNAEKRLADARMALYTARSRRVWPSTDDKIIVAWNGLMLRTFAEASEIFNSETYAEVAINNATFLLEHLRSPQGRFMRTYRNGTTNTPGFLEDYASLILGLLAVYEATFDPQWFTVARALADEMLRLFHDPEESVLYDTSEDHDALITRPREINDNATPSGASLAVEALLWLTAVTGESSYHAVAEKYLLALVPTISHSPMSFSHMLCQLDRWLSPSLEVAIVGHLDDPLTLDLLTAVRSHYRPNSVIACAGPSDTVSARDIPLLANRTQIDGRPTAYVCSGFACQMPVTTVEQLAFQLGDDASSAEDEQ